MGDHRMSIKIEAEFHGIKEKADMWINYFPHDCCDMDKRVIEFFQDLHERGMEKYNRRLTKYWKEEEKRKEIEELKRLQKKYPKTP